jgi:hypothetical protein
MTAMMTTSKRQTSQPTANDERLTTVTSGRTATTTTTAELTTTSELTADNDEQ